MKRSKLYTFLQHLNNNQLREFRKYLASPLGNENEDLLRLYAILTQNAASDPKKKQIWQQLFPQRPFHDQTFRLLCSDLLQHGFDFLALSRQREATFAHDLQKLEAVNQPGLQKHFRGLLRKLQKQADKAQEESPLRYYQLSRLRRIQHRHQEQQARRLSTFEHLEASDRHLDRYYIAQKLKNYCDRLGYEKTLATTGDIQLPDGFLTYVQQSGHLDTPIVRVYYLIARMLLEPDTESHFTELREILVQKGATFARNEQQVLFVHLINYCIDTKINAGRPEYFDELFTIYRSALEQRIIFRGEELDPQHYKNIITIGLHLEAFDWTEGFIQEYTASLPADQQENALNYNLAKVYFRQQAYEAVIAQLREVEYRNITYALGSKLLLLKTYYELGEYRALDSLSDSFRIYLLRNKLISKEVKQQYLNVIRLTRRLSTVAPFDEKTLSRIEAKIRDGKALADKAWLVAKLEELRPSSGQRKESPT